MSKALKAAIEANDPDAVRKAIKTVKDINRKLPGWNSPLLYACKKGADQVLEVLFEAGAIAEKRNTFPGDTPFAVAAQHQQFAVLKRLLALKQASDEAVLDVIGSACMDGKAELLEFVLQAVKPRITIEFFRLASVSKNAPTILKMLVKHGGDLQSRHDTSDAKGMTPLHDIVGSGKAEVIRTLVESGADQNARDELGRTPLMILGASLEGIEMGNSHAKIMMKSLESGEATLVAGEPPRVVDSLKAVETLLRLGADGTAKDNLGNDVFDHCAFEFLRCGKKPDRKILTILRKAGAKGSPQAVELFSAIQGKNLEAMRVAIQNGADVNRVTPPPASSTPLTWAAGSGSVEMIGMLLRAGADPNKYDLKTTPLIRAARCGNLPVVKRLIAAGADIHAVEKRDEFPDNAYSAANGNRKRDIADYLKSLGAGNPEPTKSEPLKPGVGSWNDFSELLVKSTVEQAAEALAEIIKGKVLAGGPRCAGFSFAPPGLFHADAAPHGSRRGLFSFASPRLLYDERRRISEGLSERSVFRFCAGAGR